MPARPESAFSCIRPSTEHRARNAIGAIVDAAQNGTSGVVACGKHARRWAAWATRRAGALGQGQLS
jgi:hypothetical protein